MMQQQNTPKCPSFLTPKEWRLTLSDFFQHAMETWLLILEAERHENYNECAFYAHRLKGSAGLIGFTQLAKAAGKCESVFKNTPEQRLIAMGYLEMALSNASATVAPPINTELANAS